MRAGPWGGWRRTSVKPPSFSAGTEKRPRTGQAPSGSKPNVTVVNPVLPVKRQAKLWSVDNGDGNIPAAVLGELAFKGGFGEVRSSPPGPPSLSAGKNAVVANGDAEAGKQGRAILPSYKNAVCQSSGGTAAKVGREPSSRKVTDFQFLPSWLYSNKRKRQPGDCPRGQPS